MHFSRVQSLLGWVDHTRSVTLGTWVVDDVDVDVDVDDVVGEADRAMPAAPSSSEAVGDVDGAMDPFTLTEAVPQLDRPFFRRLASRL